MHLFCNIWYYQYIMYKLYESPRRKRGWRFTAGLPYGIAGWLVTRRADMSRRVILPTCDTFASTRPREISDIDVSNLNFLDFSRISGTSRLTRRAGTARRVTWDHWAIPFQSVSQKINPWSRKFLEFSRFQALVILFHSLRAWRWLRPPRIFRNISI